MTDPFDQETRPPLTRLNRLRKIAQLVLLWEQALRSYWPVISWIALFAAVWMLEIPAMFGDKAYILALIVFVGGLYFFIGKGIKTFHWPNASNADRRLERDSALSHRPLQHIDDRLANPQKEHTRTLWKKGVNSAFDVISRLRAPRPQPQLAQRDPRALRALVALLLVIGFLAAGPQWSDRILFGLVPFGVGGAPGSDDTVVAWITPPAYTHLPRVTVQGRGTAKMTDVAAGSAIKVRVRGGFVRPYLLMGSTRVPLERIDDKTSSERSWGVETTVASAKEISIGQSFFTRQRIPMRYIEDQPPKISMKGDIKILPKGPMQFDLSVNDDYGVTSLILTMKADTGTSTLPLGAPVTLERTILSPGGQDTEIKPLYDLTWHPWAGLPVVLLLQAKDAKGQTASLDPIHIKLPERPFYHPVAKNLIDLRKRLSWSPTAAASNVAYEIESMLSHPDTFGGDTVTFLSMRSIASHLIWDRSSGSAASVIPQMWDTALRVEDGNLSLAARELRTAQENLQKLLEDPKATPAEIAAAMDKMKMAMAQYFQELYREMLKRMAENGEKPMSPDMFQNQVNADQLDAYLEQLQQQAMNGDRDAARKMLEMLQQMTDRMDPSTSMEMPPQAKAMMKAMEDLRKLIDKEKDLADRTKKAEQKKSTAYAPSLPPDQKQLNQLGLGQMPPQPQDSQQGQEQGRDPGKSPDTRAQKDEQEALRHDLGQVMLDTGDALGKIPPNLQQAEQAMRNASNALGKNDPNGAVPYEEQAIDLMQQGENEMQKQMKQMMSRMVMLSFGMGKLDPLGHPMGNNNGNSFFPDPSVKIPDQAQRKKAQEILQILRHRSGELSRPDYELDYFRRLMKQF